MNKNVSIGIIGNGFVGNSLFKLLSQKFKVLIYDILPDKSNCVFEQLIPLDIIFLCLPTPSNKKAACDITLIRNAITLLKDSCFKGQMVIKSTVSPGTTNKMCLLYSNIVFNPEFLREAFAVFDTLNPERIFIGGENTDLLRKVYLNFFSEDIIFTEKDPTNFEMVKYMSNTFLATKVALANEYYNLANQLNLDYDILRKYLILDTRISNSHLKVPGPSGKLGYGGNCFVKDTEAFIETYQKNGVTPFILKAITKYAKK